MDSRLQRVGGTRLVHLRYSDAPRVAQAIVDAKNGQARILGGQSHDTMYVEFIRDKTYRVVVRGDDWVKVFPFFRYSTSSYSPVTPPPRPPPPIMSPQPNRTMAPPPVDPAGSLKSFLAGFPFFEYSKIQNLLTILSTHDFERPGFSFNPSRPYIEDAASWLPPERRTDFSVYDRSLYNKLVFILQQLFPTDFPTTV